MTLSNVFGKVTNSIFKLISISSSAGFVSDTNYYLWPSFLPIMLMFIGIIGGCGGSTAGGLKMIECHSF
ncbi:potassium transporter TrkG [Francisella noatunensis]